MIAPTAPPRKSAYALNDSGKNRYKEKLQVTEVKKDPYCYSEAEMDSNPDKLPEIRWWDMLIYMTKTPTPSTMDNVNESIPFRIYLILSW